MKLELKRLSEKAVLPQYMTSGAAAMDLCACLPEGSVTLKPGERALIPTGLCAAAPQGYALFLFARSGLASKHGICLSNSVGVIDCDYRGEIKVALCNLSDTPFAVEHGMRVCQMALIKVEQADVLEVAELSETERDSGGFGSTGVR